MMGKNEIVAVGMIVLIILGLFSGAYFLASKQCEAKSVSFEDHSFNLYSKCMVKHEGRWLPLDNIRGFE